MNPTNPEWQSFPGPSDEVRAAPRQRLMQYLEQQGKLEQQQGKLDQQGKQPAPQP